MIVNKHINNTLREIAKETNKHLNSKDQERKYLKRILSFYKNTLTEDEQVLVMKMIFEQLNYRNIAVDPETVLAISNVKNRTIFLVFVFVIFGMITASYLFNYNNYFIDNIKDIVRAIKFIFWRKDFYASLSTIKRSWI